MDGWTDVCMFKRMDGWIDRVGGLNEWMERGAQTFGILANENNEERSHGVQTLFIFILILYILKLIDKKRMESARFLSKKITEDD